MLEHWLQEDLGLLVWWVLLWVKLEVWCLIGVLVIGFLQAVSLFLE